MRLNGINVSKNQGAISWGKVSRAGVQFVMARASYGKDGRDGSFAANVNGAKRHGLEAGAYHTCHAGSIEEARAEAAHFLACVRGVKLTYPLALDFEENPSTARADDSWSDIAIAFLREIEAAGYFAMLYAEHDPLESRFDAEKIAPFALWVAQWDDACTCKLPHGMWQNSRGGSVPGIRGHVGTNISYADYSVIIRERGLNGLG